MTALVLFSWFWLPWFFYPRSGHVDLTNLSLVFSVSISLCLCLVAVLLFLVDAALNKSVPPLGMWISRPWPIAVIVLGHFGAPIWRR